MAIDTNTHTNGTHHEVELDALVVGAGFGGIYQLKSLRDIGLNVQAIDAAGDVGGTWFWNKYPGAMSDTESYLYRYSWDLEDLRSYKWNTHYIYQKEVLAYLQHVVERYDLRKSIHLDTELTGAQWEDSARRWTVTTSTGIQFRARYLVTALGLLSRQNLPDIPGLSSFQGEMYHTGRWPDDVQLEGKRVGVIGNGSTGVQVITEVAPYVKKLVSFQRNPQYSVPSGQGEVSESYREEINEDYPQIWEKAKDSLFAFGFPEISNKRTMDASPEERDRVFDKAWAKGGGFRFMFGTFSDISTDPAANEAACTFIKDKIRQTVKDPEKAERLIPRQMYARRPLCDAGYYEQFNRENVEVVSLHDTPITEIVEDGVKTSDDVVHELDVIVFATGFDAVDGNYTRVLIHGRDGQTLKQSWHDGGPTSYLGMSVPDFPNMFTILGPNGPFSNIPPAIETQVEFITDIIRSTEHDMKNKSMHTNGDGVQIANGRDDHPPRIEAMKDAESKWTEECDRVSADSLFRKTDSWIFGSNVKGKKHSVMFYFGGLKPYREHLERIKEHSWSGFRID